MRTVTIAQIVVQAAHKFTLERELAEAARVQRDARRREELFLARGRRAVVLARFLRLWARDEVR